MLQHRTQVDLNAEQYQVVAQMAATQHRPVSEVIRELVELGLERLRRDKEERLKALDELDAMRAKLEARMGVYPGDPVAEVREERERQMDAVMFSDSAR